MAFTPIMLMTMLNIQVYFPWPELVKATKHHAHKKRNKKIIKHFYKSMAKNTRHAVKAAKHLGQGGPMRWFLKYVHPFTRTLRLLVACWRWIEAAQCRRGEVGTEEAFVSSFTHLSEAELS